MTIHSTFGNNFKKKDNGEIAEILLDIYFFPPPKAVIKTINQSEPNTPSQCAKTSLQF